MVHVTGLQLQKTKSFIKRKSGAIGCGRVGGDGAAMLGQ